MAKFQHFSNPETSLARPSSNGTFYIDYKNVEGLQRLLTPNGKMSARKRTGLSSREQRMAAQAIKRARHMALLPYTSATM